MKSSGKVGIDRMGMGSLGERMGKIDRMGRMDGGWAERPGRSWEGLAEG